MQPRASRDAVRGVHGEGDAAALKLALTAPPVDGKANKALLRFLGRRLGVAPGTLEIRRGLTARVKEVFVPRLEPAEVVRALLGD